MKNMLYAVAVTLAFSSAACRSNECEPRTCGELGFECGRHDDNCGGTLVCGPCDDDMTCTEDWICVASGTRLLGRPGHRPLLFSLGGQATLQHGTEEAAVEIINRALDLGVNYIDTAALYGPSQDYIGAVMEARRDEVFLATKSHDYSYSGTISLFAESLERLRTDHVDLYQHHHVNTDANLDAILSEDGALRAFRELRDQGSVRHLGISSHSPRILLRAIEEVDDYDCALITLNPAGRDMIDREHLDTFLERAEEMGVAVIAMKLFGRGALLRDGVSAQDLFRYSLSFPVATAVIGISELWQLEENVTMAKEFRRMSESEMRELEARF